VQILRLTIYIRVRWTYRVAASGLGSQELLTNDLNACFLALDPTADPAPRVLRVEPQTGYTSYTYNAVNRPHFEDFMGYYYVWMLVPKQLDLISLDERLRLHLAERFLHISERRRILNELPGVILKAGENWLHSPDQAEALTGVPLSVRRHLFGPPDVPNPTPTEQ